MSGIHLVTGGAGYFGATLVQSLVCSRKRVRVLDLHAAGVPEGVETIRGDVRDTMLVERALEGVEVVYNAVGVFPAAGARKPLLEIHQGGTRNVLDAARRAGVRKVVHISSSAVFGVPEINPVDDFTPLRPCDNYGRAKLAAERVCLDHANSGLDISIIRPRTLMGNGRLRIMQLLFEWVREGRNIPVLGQGDNRYQFLHVDDLTSACLLAGQCPEPAIFNLGAERFGTMRETLDALCAHANSGSRVVSVPSSAAAAFMRLVSRLGVVPLSRYHALMYGRSMYFDLARPKRVLRWTSRYSNEEMFIQSYDWHVAQQSAGLSPKSPVAYPGARESRFLEAASRALSAL
jgi:nucleoside-diphosphate-sugar epimerase